MAPTEPTQHTPLQTAPVPAVTPAQVNVDVTGGSGMMIAWKDGHRSHYTFAWLRDACPCALCDEERTKQHRDPGEPPRQNPLALPMFKVPVKPVEAVPVGRYAIRFSFNDGHQHGIYSWEFLRLWCPCRECSALRNTAKLESGPAQ
jgi:DUF971 family protein